MNVRILRTVIMIVLGICVYVHATAQDYRQVDRIVDGWPSSFSSPEKLAGMIEASFTKPEEQARAAFAWIAHHVSYDVKALDKPQKVLSFSYSSEEEKKIREKQLQQQLAMRTLRKHKAVCHGYATLFKIVCNLTGIECVIISGTAKIQESDIGRMPGNPNHAWNAVKINSQWKFVDATWGAGYINGDPVKFFTEYDDVYFFTPPGKFFLNHYPADPKWLYVKMTPEEFASLPLYYPGALHSDIRIIKPADGIVLIPDKKPFRIIMKNYNGETINFALNNKNYPDPLKPQRKKNQTSFILKTNRPGYLTLFINGKAFTGYKLINKQ